MHNNIWYRSSVGMNIPVWEDRGTLTYGDGRFQFCGRYTTVSGLIRSVQRTQMGINSWVHVAYSDTKIIRDAYFMAGGLLGWEGLLGGNRRLAEALGDNCLQ